MKDIFNTLLQSQKASQYALDNQGKIQGFQFAIVTKNIDPIRLRRIRVSLESKGGLTETDWLMPCSLVPYTDLPLPPINSSVIVGFVNGNPHDGFYVGNVLNRTNEPDLSQSDPVNDSTTITPGNLVTVSKKTENHRIDDSLLISAGKGIKIINDAGASIELTAEGLVIITDAYGHVLTLGGGSGALSIDLQGDILNIVNSGDLTINNQSAIVVGSTDSDGDVNNDRGY